MYRSMSVAVQESSTRVSVCIRARPGLSSRITQPAIHHQKDDLACPTSWSARQFSICTAAPKTGVKRKLSATVASGLHRRGRGLAGCCRVCLICKADICDDGSGPQEIVGPDIAQGGEDLAFGAGNTAVDFKRQIVHGLTPGTTGKRAG